MLHHLAVALLAVTTQQNTGVSFDASAPPRVLAGTLSEPLAGELSQAVTAWANANKPLLGLAPSVTLRASNAFGTRFGASFHLVQTVEGVDVHDGETVVTLDEKARVSLVSQSPLSFGSATVQWNVSAQQALRTAAQRVKWVALQPNGVPYGGARGELFSVRGELHAGWWLFLPLIDRVHSYYAAVDAVTGELLFIEDKIVHDSLSAKVYASNPGGLDAGVGAAPTIDVELKHDDGGSMVLPGVPGGFLNGDRLTAYNCCPNKDCVMSSDPDAGARATGMTSAFGVNVSYDTSICQRVQRASNKAATHASGDFVYAPIDPPDKVNGMPVAVAQSDPADVDEFSEVHAFFHVNQIYDWETRLSVAAAPIYPGNQPAIVPFKMRDERKTPARVPAVWANVTVPNLNNVSNPVCFTGSEPCVINGLMRVDNAAFVPLEQMPGLIIPEYMNDVDTLVIFQGDLADFGYDAPVLWHESGHGVVYSTAGLDPGASLAVDGRSANNEAGAMHEGLADYTAAAFGNDPRVGVYVGPRLSGAGGGMLAQDVALRNLDNNLTCPDVLWGEVHQDSQHFSAALWQARTTKFAGTDNGATFDAVMYATLVSMAPKENFASTAAILEAHLNAAFPNISGGADMAMKAIFDAKGVTHCDKVLDVTGVTGGRPYYGISDPSIESALMAGTLLPGPIQFKLHLPQGAASLKVTGQPPPMTGFGFGGSTSASLLAKAGSPITFTLQTKSLLNDALAPVAFTGTTSLTASVDVAVPCDGDLYFTLASTQGATIEHLDWTVTPAPQCAPPDGGTGGGGGGGGGSSDGGDGVTMLPFIGTSSGKNAGGCGCGVVDANALVVAALALIALRRRK